MRNKTTKIIYCVYSHKENGVMKNYREFSDEKLADDYKNEILCKHGNWEMKLKEVNSYFNKLY